MLKGARLPLAEATAVEMDQFLRLMFSPVAGRMVRTLFLERLRAERELAAPAGAGIERLAVGPISAARSAWVEALAKVKLPQVTDDTLPDDTLQLIDQQGARRRVALRVLDEAPLAADAPLAVLAPAGPYGRVLEVVGADDATAAALGCARHAPAVRALAHAGADERAAAAARAGARRAGADRAAMLGAARCGRPGLPRRRGLPRRCHAGVDWRTAELARGPSGDVIDRSRIGYTTEPTTVRIDGWRVKLFCQAIGETDEVYWNPAAARAAGHPRVPAAADLPEGARGRAFQQRVG